MDHGKSARPARHAGREVPELVRSHVSPFSRFLRISRPRVSGGQLRPLTYSDAPESGPFWSLGRELLQADRRYEPATKPHVLCARCRMLFVREESQDLPRVRSTRIGKIEIHRLLRAETETLS